MILWLEGCQNVLEEERGIREEKEMKNIVDSWNKKAKKGDNGKSVTRNLHPAYLYKRVTTNNLRRQMPIPGCLSQRVVLFQLKRQIFQNVAHLKYCLCNLTLKGCRRIWKSWSDSGTTEPLTACQSSLNSGLFQDVRILCQVISRFSPHVTFSRLALSLRGWY